MTFGYLYPPLHSLGLRTYEFEEFNRFLEDHSGHLLFLNSDHDDPAMYAPEIQKLQDRLDEDDGFYQRFKAEERREDERVASGEFVDAYYGVRCARCRVTYAATERGRFRAFEEMQLPESAVSLFLECWAPLSPDDGWNHRLMPPLDPWEPFLEHLPEFLRRHRHHRLEAVLSKTPFLSAVTGEDLKRAKEESEAQRQKRDRILTFIWPKSGMFRWLITRVFAGWLLLNGLPMVGYMVMGSSRSPWRVLTLTVLISSALWTYLGARLAWTRIARTLLKTVGRCVLAALQGYSPSYLAWFALKEFPPRIWYRLPHRQAVADAALDLHLWLLPTVFVLGALEGWLQWHYFRSVLGARNTVRRTP
jgi:hypothetical protein